ncbi:MAG: response regulator [Lachnospiraceae bacterium]|nr:response regulator [Lachnospiraceae bacterium]
MNGYRMVIADDEKMIRDGLAQMRWTERQIEVVGVAKNGLEAQEYIDSVEFDVLLTDIKMPGMGGVELAKNLQKANPVSKTILLSGYGEFSFAQQALGCGVFDYILKPSTPEQILESVGRACEAIEKERQARKYVWNLEQKVDGYQEVLGVREVVEKAEQSEKSTNIHDILSYIYANYAENLTLSALAEQFYFSPVYMSSYIKRHTGHTFLEILTSVRMFHTARLLRETSMKNREIGMRVGILDERYLGQVFKKAYGITPYEYRKKASDPSGTADGTETLESYMRKIGVGE